MMEFSKETDKILPALHAAIPTLGVIIKDGVNTHTDSKYATINGVKAAIDQPLYNAGFLLIDTLDGDGFVTRVTTRLCHVESGQWVQSTFSAGVPAAKAAQFAQAVGSLQTYGRRYNRVGLLNLSAHDDDGNAAAIAPVVHWLDQIADEKNNRTYAEMIDAAVEAVEKKGGDVVFEIAEKLLGKAQAQLQNAGDAAIQEKHDALMAALTRAQSNELAEAA